MSQRSLENLKRSPKRIRSQLTQKTVKLTSDQVAKIKRLGEGNFNRGVQIAVSLTQSFPKSLPKQDELAIWLQLLSVREDLPEEIRVAAEEWFEQLERWEERSRI